MKWQHIILTFLISILIVPVTLSAMDFGTAEEAKAMLKEAVMALEKDQAKALKDITEGKMFKEKDLYVFCFDANTGIITGHGGKASMIGMDAKTLKDKTGANFGEELFKNAVKGEYREVGYFWPRPGETEQSQKSSYITRVGDQSCGVGYYK